MLTPLRLAGAVAALAVLAVLALGQLGGGTQPGVGGSPSAGPTVASPSPAPSTSSTGSCSITLLHDRFSDRRFAYSFRATGFEPFQAQFPPVVFKRDGVEFARVSGFDLAPEEARVDATGSFASGISLPNEGIPPPGGKWTVVVSDATCTAEATFDPYEFASPSP